MSTTTTQRYSTVAIVLHWLLALFLLGMLAMGTYMADLPFSPWRLKLYNWHKWAGVTILVLSVLRLVWRLTHRPPALPVAIESAMPSWQLKAYHATHVALYALFFIVPLVGWAYSSAAGFPIVLFGVLPLPDFVPASTDACGCCPETPLYRQRRSLKTHDAGARLTYRPCKNSRHTFLDLP